jgi:hypothetical protein
LNLRDVETNTSSSESLSHTQKALHFNSTLHSSIKKHPTQSLVLFVQIKDLSGDKLARPTWGPKLFWTEKEPNLELARKQHYGRDKDTGPTGRTPGFEPSRDIPDGEGRGANETDRAD